MNRLRKKMVKAKKGGLTTTDVAKIRALAKREADKMENVATEKAFLYMLAIPLNILVHDYWPKSAKRKAPKFIAEVMKLFDVVMDGLVSDKELADLLKDMAGVEIQAEWLKRGDTSERK